MTSGQIRMTPETMKERAGQYRTESDNVGEIITNLDNLLEALREEWEGAASAAYAEKYGELRPAFTDAQNLLIDIASALDKTAEAVAATDEQIANQFKA